MTKRRYRIVRKLGMTMLFQNDAFLFLQVKAFIVVVYLLISCLHLLLILKLYTL